MPGLLSPPQERLCPNGHGTLTAAEGVFGLPQMTIEQVAPAGLRIEPTQTRLVSTGKLFSVKVFHCPVCGEIKLIDSDKA